MKITLDTTNKTIKVEGTVNLKELQDMMKKLFPDEEWKEYTLEGTTTNWTYYPTYPWTYTYVTHPTTSVYVLTTG